MENTRTKTGYSRKATWIVVGLLVVVIAVIVAASNILYKRTVVLLTDNLRDAITTISVTQAANIDASDLAALQTKDDWQKPEWQHIVQKLHNAKYANENVVFMYIFRKKATDPTQMEFVGDADSINPFANDIALPSGEESVPASTCATCVDVNRDGLIEPEGADKLQWPGQDYAEAVDIPEAFEAYSGPLTSRDLYTDDYGTVLTGYAPIRDEKGDTVAVLAADVKADDFLTITTQTLLPFLIFIIFLTFTISVLTVAILLIWRRHTKSLEDLTEQLEHSNLGLADLNGKLKGLDKLKTEFLSLASHQLRSPLTAIKGYASMLTEGSFGKMDEKQDVAVKRIYTSAQGLVSIVEDLLNVSKIEQGGMKYEFMTTELSKSVTDLYNEMKIPAESKGLELTLDIPPYEKFIVNADPTKLKQVFLNLTDNSIKYTPKGFVKLSLRHEGSNIVFAVSDNGVGISPETMGKLFGKFNRGEGGKLNTGGSGLGLYLAREIARVHKGDIVIESEGLGKGSTFKVVIPAVASQTPGSVIAS